MDMKQTTDSTDTGKSNASGKKPQKPAARKSSKLPEGRSPLTIAVVVALIGALATIFAAFVGTDFFENLLERWFSSPDAAGLHATTGTPVSDNPEWVQGFLVEINGDGRLIRVELYETQSVQLNSTLFIEPILARSASEAVLDWQTCKDTVKLVALSENRVAYTAAAPGADCVRLSVTTASGVADAVLTLEVQSR